MFYKDKKKSRTTKREERHRWSSYHQQDIYHYNGEVVNQERGDAVNWRVDYKTRHLIRSLLIVREQEVNFIVPYDRKRQILTSLRTLSPSHRWNIHHPFNLLHLNPLSVLKSSGVKGVNICSSVRSRKSTPEIPREPTPHFKYKNPLKWWSWTDGNYPELRGYLNWYNRENG